MTVLALFALTGCVEDVAENKVAAEVAPAAEQAKPDAAPAPVAPKGTALAVDVSKSSIKALGAKVTKTHDIMFPTFSGTVTVDGDTVTGMSFEVDMTALEADVPKLTNHLKSADFFDVEKNPKATFTSTAIKAGGEDATHTVTGDLTMVGKSNSVTFPMTMAVGPDSVTGNTEFAIKRHDWGISYPGRPDDLIQENVVLTINFAAPRAEATAKAE